MSIALFAIFRALEFSWNMSEDGGLVWGYKPGGKVKRERPWWFGSWMLQPLALGQLFHAVTFDRDCAPKVCASICLCLLSHANACSHSRACCSTIRLRTSSRSHLVTPPISCGPRSTRLSIASRRWRASTGRTSPVSPNNRLSNPTDAQPRPYISPTLFPDKETLPPSLSPIAPLTSTAHPLITSLSCATLHPSDPSCLRTYLTFWLRSFPPLARLLLIFYSALALPRLKHLYHYPLTTLHRLLARALRSSTFVTGAFSTAWGTICLSQAYLPKHVLATQRFFLSGFAAGLWAFVERKNGRSAFLYTAKASMDSLWKVGVKRRWWRGMRGGDVWVFVLALMATGVVYERDREAIREGAWRKGVSWVRGEGFRDWGAEEEEGEEEE